jgi:hypothetical protein
MVLDHKNNRVALLIMGAVTFLNVCLAANFVEASGRALAAVFDGKSIFLLAGVELLAILLTYVISKHRSFMMPARMNRPVNQS